MRQAETRSGIAILVTGTTGHVARAVVCRLASLGHDVVAMVRDVQAASRRLPSGIALRVADYEDASALKRALAGIDILISSDGDASAVMRGRRDGVNYFATNPASVISAAFSLSSSSRNFSMSLPVRKIGFSACFSI